MMIKILAILFSFLSFSSQSEEPVSWKYELIKIDSNQYNLTLDAEIIEGWKLYSQYSPVEGTATEFVLLTPNLSSWGEVHLYIYIYIIGVKVRA